MVITLQDQRSHLIPWELCCLVFTQGDFTQSEAWYENFLLFLRAISRRLNLYTKTKEAMTQNSTLKSYLMWTCDKFKIRANTANPREWT